ncbi:DMT family transporter [Calidifontibacter sp. DB0510]|uniref:DMT family transporter n=1 Tax=Metallococcus carri TaxID=1656884 RepID=A0A967B4M9_9MICO|nr:DMT family transporter [Metallococcus carri]NHN54551.1 DMT family transporter [Metallococcus carri]NOP36610.1 DMT family transporter [Calidifontibacter sp. DB2511S]
MAVMTHDEVMTPARSATATGLGFALASAASFGMSGSIGRGLLDAGWSPAAAVLVRITVAAIVVLPAALISLRGRWGLLRREAGVLLAYGAVAVAGCQLAYFSAVQHMPVAVALLVEYTSPVAVVLWLWLRHGERPARATVLGAGVAALGLVLVLDLLSGASLSVIGMAWALFAMVGAAVYFVLSARDSQLPPIVLAGGGLVVGAIVLGAAGLVGIVPLRGSTTSVRYAVGSFPWWLPLLALGVITAAIAYVTGIAASRRLGSRLASFVALLEVVFSLMFAAILLHELPGLWQLVGGALILAGVVVVKLGEPRLEEPIVHEPV